MQILVEYEAFPVLQETLHALFPIVLRIRTSFMGLAQFKHLVTDI